MLPVACPFVQVMVYVVVSSGATRTDPEVAPPVEKLPVQDVAPVDDQVSIERSGGTTVVGFATSVAVTACAVVPQEVEMGAALESTHAYTAVCTRFELPSTEFHLQ